MGCWNGTCLLGGPPIVGGERVVAFIIQTYRDNIHYYLLLSNFKIIYFFMCNFHQYIFLSLNINFDLNCPMNYMVFVIQ